MDDARTVHWRRDASTSRTVRVLWALGAGTFFAMVLLVAFWRLFGLAGETGGRTVTVPTLETIEFTITQLVLLAGLTAVAVTILALAAAGNTGRRLERLTRRLPLSSPSDAKFTRAMDAAVGAVVMGAIISSLILVARIAAQGGQFAVGAGPFTGLAAATLPLALVAIVLSAFLQSVGALDLEEGAIYLYEPEEAIDLETIDGARVRHIGDTAILTLEYAQPDGQYVPGPRRLVVPSEIAREVTVLVGSRP